MQLANLCIILKSQVWIFLRMQLLEKNGETQIGNNYCKQTKNFTVKSTKLLKLINSMMIPGQKKVVTNSLELYWAL